MAADISVSVAPTFKLLLENADFKLSSSDDCWISSSIPPIFSMRSSRWYVAIGKKGG